MQQLVSFVAALHAAASAPSDHDVGSRVDVAQADDVLRSVLDAWKEGRAVDDPDAGADFVADPLWQRGYRLDRFEIGPDLEAVGLDVSRPVELWMHSPAGEAVREGVRYVVSTSPRRVVVRSTA